MKHQEITQARKTASDLFRQALHESQPKVHRGVYIATPNRIGAAMERFLTLCKAEGVDPRTGEKVTE